MTNNLLPGERLDDLQLNGLELIQDPERFCFGVDAVLLSDFARVKENETVLDMGTGTGIIPILLSAKTKGKHFTGLEIQEESAQMARRSVAHNHLEDKIEIVTGDIKEAAQIFKPAFFDVITVNPPYMLHQHGLQNPKDAIAIARHEILCSLDDILRESMKLLQDKGRFYMIHRPFRLTEILIKMNQYKIEPKKLQFVHPYIHKEPTMVLIEGVRGAKSRVRIEPPLIMYQ
ncbi:MULTISPECIES: tRNA1(Val) (adenine(37)-N6)-methyltransferase [Lachnospiraceae]|jgi:tRNA1Val (adenine37-N6)-methyltransferase|uniref:tRNA1(Val) (Adenine(37)-N6)-methyltransferase n=1 Tax=Faecalicatena acetigenes TaxID=2981790 RepID=A0ABT2T9I9_9FIRM|nr:MULTISPECIES: tRNA1(Val) (adenine(37)-N6)-methyltransferase [Lachnospiraceae]MCU6746900.1 tRNA1(Val) (adenine(37)-N6)-methyltransferase [Faecalicatena acetigenes]RGT72867.1 tRNA1(Val) (adenine(37)-N6)-methyltransferase [Ruminococcus sp. AF18-22]SCH50056.1 tRNA1(Val) (adenine(37)-N6)-methyltransferase [uncultured Clostridium sp.]